MTSMDVQIGLRLGNSLSMLRVIAVIAEVDIGLWNDAILKICSGAAPASFSAVTMFRQAWSICSSCVDGYLSGSSCDQPPEDDNSRAERPQSATLKATKKIGYIALLLLTDRVRTIQYPLTLSTQIDQVADFDSLGVSQLLLGVFAIARICGIAKMRHGSEAGAKGSNGRHWVVLFLTR
jgi:hypothetical protein